VALCSYICESQRKRASKAQGRGEGRTQKERQLNKENKNTQGGTITMSSENVEETLALVDAKKQLEDAKRDNNANKVKKSWDTSSHFCSSNKRKKIEIEKCGGFITKGIGPVKKIDNRTTCVIHEKISFCPLIKAFVDSRQFQRLRDLRQVGVTYLTYMCANHTRFDHSLGVYHLARKLCLHLREEQPYLNITDKDILCVSIAALCHDLGHGPFR
jgi:hypothetical protein